MIITIQFGYIHNNTNDTNNDNNDDNKTNSNSDIILAIFYTPLK